MSPKALRKFIKHNPPGPKKIRGRVYCGCKQCSRGGSDAYKKFKLEGILK